MLHFAPMTILRRKPTFVKSPKIRAADAKDRIDWRKPDLRRTNDWLRSDFS
jgi:hypothetical protein